MPDPAPRNHARRVEDLQALHRDGLLRYIEATPLPRVYVVEVAGERHEIPARLLDTWLDGWRTALTASNCRKTRRTGNGTRQNRTLDTAEDTHD